MAENTVVCIVEAMQGINEIKAEKSGVIAKRLVDNGAPVAYNQPLFEIETTQAPEQEEIYQSKSSYYESYESPSNGPSEPASSGSLQQREDNILDFCSEPVFAVTGAIVTMFIGAVLGTVFLDINSSDESEEFVQFLAGIGAIIGGGIWGWHVENVCIGLGVGTGFAIVILLGSVAAGIICMALFAAIGWAVGRAIRS